MKRLPSADALQFAIHCLTCRRCHAVVEDARRFVRAIKGALGESFALDFTVSSPSSLTRTASIMLGGVRAQLRLRMAVSEGPGKRR